MYTMIEEHDLRDLLDQGKKIHTLLKKMIRFSYKISCNFRLQSYSIYIFFLLEVNLINLLLDYIFFLYPPYLQNF